ncbi:MAG: methyltransferase family protein [Myxococcota bacterium]
MGFVHKRLRPRLWLVYALAVGALWLARPSPATLALGGVPIALGVSLRLWATGHLHKNDALTMTGPYAYLRHPLYLGTLLIALGFAVMAAHPVVWAALGVFALGYFGYYMPYKNRIEGARLEALYGDSYRRYAVAVPRLVPRLHPYEPLAADRPPEAAWRRERFRDNHEIGTTAVVALAVAAMVGRWAIGL